VKIINYIKCILLEVESKIRNWLLDIIVGDRPIVRNMCFNGDGVKKGWILLDPYRHNDKAVVSPRERNPKEAGL
jgi:hypothetical protein